MTYLVRVLTIVVVAVLFALVVLALVAASRRRVPSEVTSVIEAGTPAIEGVVPVPGPPPRGPPLPVMLVHGLFGFDRIGVPGAGFDYFRGIALHLGELGCTAHAVRLPMMSSVLERAEKLVAAIDALGLERIDLVAHSLGGLDARGPTS